MHFGWELETPGVWAWLWLFPTAGRELLFSMSFSFYPVFSFVLCVGVADVTALLVDPPHLKLPTPTFACRYIAPPPARRTQEIKFRQV